VGLGAEGRRPSEASVNLKLEAIIKLNADLCHTFCEHDNFIRISLLYFEKKEVNPLFSLHVEILENDLGGKCS